MRYRNPKKESDLFSMIEHQQSVKTVKGINKLNAVIDWELFREELESILGYDSRDPKRGGRPPFDAVLMLKVLVLQKYYGLSDEETEYQIMDRFSFLQFLGLQAGDDVPDARTIWDFKQLLEKDGRDGTRWLFERFGEQLQTEGLLAKEGSIVDASFVAAPRQRNSREQNARIKKGERPEGFEADTPKGRQKDCDARWTGYEPSAWLGPGSTMDSAISFIIWTAMPSSAAERPESPEKGLNRPNGIGIGAKVRIQTCNA